MSLGLGFSGGGGSLTNIQNNKVKSLSNNFRGIYKPGGSNISVFEGYGAPSSIMKIEAEAPFSRVRVWILHRGAYGQGGWKVAVAATDKYAVDTVSNAFYPQKGGVVNNAAQTTSDESGWVQAKWGGAGDEIAGGGSYGLYSGSVPRGEDTSGKLYPSYDFDQSWQQSGVSNAHVGIVCSSWMDCKSITPNPVQPSGVARPFLLIKFYRVPGSFPIEGTSAYNVLAATAQTIYDEWILGTNPVRRLRYLRTYEGGDGIADYTKVPAAAGAPNGTVDEHYPYIAIEYEYDVPARSFAMIGDSNIEGSAGSGFLQAIRELSTPAKPLNCANFGMSSNRSIQYFSMLDSVIAEGMGFTDWIIGSHSTNDSVRTTFEVNKNKLQILRVLNEADSLGVTVWIYTHWSGIHGADDPEVVEYLTWIRGICSQGRAKLIDVSANWLDAYSSDGGTHANTTGIAYCKDLFKAALSSNL